jgi:hypothetical protein
MSPSFVNYSRISLSSGLCGVVPHTHKIYKAYNPHLPFINLCARELFAPLRTVRSDDRSFNAVPCEHKCIMGVEILHRLVFLGTYSILPYPEEWFDMDFFSIIFLSITVRIIMKLCNFATVYIGSCMKEVYLIVCAKTQDCYVSKCFSYSANNCWA